MNTQPKQKILSLSLILMMIVTLCPIPARAASEYTYNMTDSGTVTITGYTGNATHLDIPEEMDGAPVTAIADEAFQYNLKIQEVQLPETITDIGEAAFNDCSQLRTINWPQSLKTIGKDAFFSCTRLESVNLPEGVKTLGDGAFYRCYALKTITIPGTLEEFGDYTFGYCTALEEATVEEGIQEIPQQTFFYDSSLKKITLAQSVQKIGMRAFEFCSSLEDGGIILPEKLDSIGYRAFNGTMLQNMTINAVHIEKQAFWGIRLTTVTLGKDVTEIGSDAFNNAAFSVDSENTCYKSDENGALFTKDGTVLLYYPSTTGESGAVYQVPDGVTQIGDKVFQYNYGINEIILPDTVTSIGNNAFQGCSVQKINLPDTITEIGEEAFANCPNLTEVTIPSGITELKKGTFGECQLLSSVTLDENLEKIGDNVFANCSQLTEITIPDSVYELNGSSFYRELISPNTSEETLQSMQPALEEMEDDYRTDESSEDAAVQTTSIDLTANGALTVHIGEENANLLLGEDGNIYSKDGSTLIAHINQFDETSLVIPDTVTTIGDSAVVSYGIKEITIPDSVTNIGESAVGTWVYMMSDGRGKVNKFRIYGSEGSAAQTYAKNNEMAFYTGTPVQNATEVTLSGGETFQYQIENLPADMVTYASSNNSVASVDQNGLITAKANGSADIYAVNASETLPIKVTVQGGADPVDPYADYQEFGSQQDYETWENSYYEYNKELLELQNAGSTEGGIKHLTIQDNSNINDYSSNNYVAIKANLVGGDYIEESNERFGEGGYEQFKTVTKNLHEEIQRYKLNENLKVYSGTSDISFITGGGSSLQEMVDSIGKTVTNPNVISTSLSHQVASVHGKFTLEIYAPKDLTNGVYLNSISEFKTEYELLLNYGLTYKVLDAGVRTVQISSFPDSNESTDTKTENYIKLLVSPQPDEPTKPDDPTTPDEPTKPEDPTTPDTPTQPEDPATPDTPSTPDTPATPNGSNTADSSGKKQNSATDTQNNKKAKTSKTGDSANMQTQIVLLVIAGGAIIGVIAVGCYRRKNRKHDQEK